MALRPANNPRVIRTLLTETQTATLRAVVDCIIPADDYPGGWDAGVGDYLARLLTHEPPFLFACQRGLDALEAQAPGFARLPADAQNALLTLLEQDQEHGAFFRLLVIHVMEGFYADSGNGGNRGGIAWQMIGYTVTA